MYKVVGIKVAGGLQNIGSRGDIDEAVKLVHQVLSHSTRTDIGPIALQSDGDGDYRLAEVQLQEAEKKLLAADSDLIISWHLGPSIEVSRPMARRTPDPHFVSDEGYD
ncbi:hypothetical protein A3A40_02125 [Candidatus Kaiserbacteria bacterium RIFCSPLOWO2_01_FULL_54_20]|uniref:Uncharacterized protein n=1 Tax=Candidatus Kaiserbacteria bacterium RIFCSPLOWO2_01_FULL_54_20 TaxID=1798513 RepID=A0A1F6EJX6_9BACT|nr:MAG: hypothetical protein A3A40_02125 [Candidatus Kaiserbacteria bacterium RIFCSPLOWO2_01_FULL_54_20]